MKHYLRWLPAAILLFPLVALGQTGEPKHLAVAQAFVNDLLPENSSYRHKNTVVKFKGVNGATMNECHTDCSGFANSLLKRVYGLSMDDLKQRLGSTRPLAREYHDAIAAGKGFHKVTRVHDIKPGDFIAIKYEEGAADTGHVMLVVKVQPLTPSAPLVEGTKQWGIEVIDESSSGHGKGDTRLQDGKLRGGLGSGVFRLYTNSAGHFAGYAWSTSAKSKLESPKNRHLIVGRFELKDAP